MSNNLVSGWKMATGLEKVSYPQFKINLKGSSCFFFLMSGSFLVYVCVVNKKWRRGTLRAEYSKYTLTALGFRYTAVVVALWDWLTVKEVV